MREIKFRGKRIDTGEWVFGDLVSCSKKHAYIVTYFEKGEILPEEALTACKCVVYKVKAETVGQFTGLKDKNGKEIYEGDVLKCKNKRIRKVIFKDGAFQGENVPHVPEQQFNAFPFTMIELKTLEIIGTIRDQKAEVEG